MTTDDPSADLSVDWALFLDEIGQRARLPVPLETRGTLTRLAGLVLEASGIRSPVGSQCLIDAGDGQTVLAEVVGFSAGRAFLMPAGDVRGLSPGAAVTPAPPYRPLPKLGHPGRAINPSDKGVLRLPLGNGLLGRVVDAHGQPMDGQGPLADVDAIPMDQQPLNAMEREPIRTPLDTGVRCINSLLTVGRGQRIGLFAGSGVGKSVLLGMMARYTQADVIVVGLIGERGREVKEFIEDILGADGRSRSVVVAAPADAPPLVRMQGAAYATAVAEHFRDQGQHVLLLMDSLTRYAMAQREIALAIGEPPATKGYPPSCFAKLPSLVERSGNGLNGVGSITAFYTVLSEGDDQQDPIADAARAILDGHVVLSRSLAEAGHFPAIDVEQSASRVMNNVTTQAHWQASRRFKALYSRYQKTRDLIQLGVYAKGSDAETDQAIALFPAMQAFLAQDMNEGAPLNTCIADLMRLVSPGLGAARP
jgi:flagellum-specific ATP synthase